METILHNQCRAVSKAKDEYNFIRFDFLTLTRNRGGIVPLSEIAEDDSAINYC